MDGTIDGTILDGFDEGLALGNTEGALDGVALDSMDGTIDGTILDGFDEELALDNTVGSVDGVSVGSMDGKFDGPILAINVGIELGDLEGELVGL